jgi:hypothetical protein
MVYPALLPLMRTPRLPVVDWADAPADLNRLVRFAERRNLVSAHVPSHFKRSLILLFCCRNACPNAPQRYVTHWMPALHFVVTSTAVSTKPVSVITKLQKKLLEMLCSALWRRPAFLTLLYDTHCWQCLLNDAHQVVIYCLFHGTVSV